ncbi:hypothetical protein ACIBG4_21085 [Nonomuraea sp. NPDC050383]|uniref:hypothetical protein n=1 Tax=Nonomuraea sp. NPDC050383 TaxID=3364362 RepID=UPI00378F349F
MMPCLRTSRPAFSDTFAGIAPASLPGFILAQLIGGVVGLVLVRGLFGRHATGSNAASAADLAIPKPEDQNNRKEPAHE